MFDTSTIQWAILYIFLAIFQIQFDRFSFPSTVNI